jgi:hypothetical protein
VSRCRMTVSGTLNCLTSVHIPRTLKPAMLLLIAWNKVDFTESRKVGGSNNEKEFLTTHESASLCILQPADSPHTPASRSSAPPTPSNQCRQSRRET